MQTTYSSIFVVAWQFGSDILFEIAALTVESLLSFVASNQPSDEQGGAAA